VRRALLTPQLSFANLRGDLFGGLTAAVVALPLALAFGVASGAGPVAGLYGAIAVGFFAAVFGGTPAQISGPTGPMTVVAATVFAQFADRPELAFTVVMLSGLLQVAFGLFRVGGYIDLMPYPVISGFMSGIGCIILITQLPPLLGFPAPAGVLAALEAAPRQISSPNPDALLAGLVALAICFVTPARIGRLVPATLLALVAGSLLVAAIWTTAPTLGDIPTALPSLQAPAFEMARVRPMLVAALILALLGSIDSLLTSVIADNMTHTFHDSNRELVGQGLGNLASGLLGGIPGAGATIRTLTNVRSGGRTPLSGAFHATVLLAVALGLGPLAARVPQAVLAGILFKVGIDVIDWPYLRRAWRAPRAGVIFMLIVLGLTVLVDVITAVMVGTVLASLLFVKRMADLQRDSITVVTQPDNPMLTREESDMLARADGRVVVLNLSGPMSFGAANGLTRRMAGAAACEVLVIDLSGVSMIDSSASLALGQVIVRARERQWQVVVAGLNAAVDDVFRRLDVLARVDDRHRCATRLEALTLAVDLVDRTRAPHGGYTG
jgi:SulP family sulfate permease